MSVAVPSVTYGKTAAIRNLADASTIVPEAIDFASDAGIEDLYRQFRVEYQTLAKHREELLATSLNQFVVIQGTSVRVFSTLETAYQQGRVLFPSGLFFLGRVTEVDFDNYLYEMAT